MAARTALSVLTLSTMLVACGDDTTVDPAAFEALQNDLDTLLAQHDALQAQHDALRAQHDDDVTALEEELAAVTGGFDLTELSDAVDDHEGRLGSIEGNYLTSTDLSGLAAESYVDSAVAGIDLTGLATETYVDSAVAGMDLSAYATQTWVGAQGYLTSSALPAYALDADLSSVDSRVSTIEADYLLAADISDHATETYVDSAIVGIDLSTYALGTDLDDVDTRVTAIEADYLQASDLSGYTTETWVGSQGYSTDAIDATLVDLLDYISVDTSTDSVVFDSANVYIQSGAGTTDATVNGLGNLIVGYNDASYLVLDRTGSHNLVVGDLHSYSSWGGLLGGKLNTVSGVGAVALGYGNEAAGDYSSVSGGTFNVASGTLSSVSGGFGNEASGGFSSVSGGEDNEASSYRSSISGGYDNEAAGDYSSVSGGYDNFANGYFSSVSGGDSVTANGESDWAAGGLWEDY